MRAAKATWGLIGLSILTLPGLALAGTPIRSAKSLLSKLEREDKDAVREHLKLARKLERADLAWETWQELQAIFRLDPENSQAKKLAPDFPPPPPDAPNEDYLKARAEIDAEFVKELAELLERGVEGELTADELAPVANRILSYDTDHEGARKALGFIGSAESWTNARRSLRLGNVTLALGRIPGPGESDRDFAKLAGAMGGSWRVVKSPHAYYVTSSVAADAIERLAKAAECAWELIHADFYGSSEVFKGGAGGGRPATGVKLAPFNPPVFLVLDGMEEHKRYLDKVVTDPNLKVRGEKLGFCSTAFAPERALILESRNGATNIEEWGALMMTIVTFNQRFGQHRPEYLRQGLARYYSGLVSSQAVLRVVSGGTMSDEDRKRMRPGDYLQLCWTARWAYERFRAPLPAEAGLRKALDAMNRGDAGIAAAFVDWLIAERPAELVRFLELADSQERSQDEAFSEAFPLDRAAMDAAFEAWFKRNY